ncbi:hypothetical protein RUM44_011560 [Polyplax serrata]|uniref:Uncharacterized protein n=1 Tax=Polyplax serrata TaxID=468196 RepID=A0ABR1AQD4_POLSC
MTVSQPFSADKDEKMNKKEEVSIGECKNNVKRKEKLQKNYNNEVEQCKKGKAE